MKRRCLFAWSGAVWTTAASLGIVCALVVGAQGRSKDRTSVQSSAQSSGTAVAQIPGAERVASDALGCPVSSCVGLIDGDSCTLSQSLDTSSDGTNTIACGVAGPPNETTPNGWSRCFDIQGETGLPNTKAFEVETVTFGVQQATVAGIELLVILYQAPFVPPLGVGPCNPNAAGVIELCREAYTTGPTDVSDMPVLCAADADCIACSDTPTAVCHFNQCVGGTDDGDACTRPADCADPGVCTAQATPHCDIRQCRVLEPITVSFPSNPVVPPGRDLLVEIRNTKDGTEPGFDFAFRVVSNPGGECGTSWQKSPDGSCGISTWEIVDDLGAMPGDFVNSDLVITATGIVRPSSAQAVCGNGTLQGCEECDPSTACPLGEGVACCEADCTWVDCGDSLAGDCCDPAGHNNPRCGQCAPNPAASAAACCEEVCALDPLCCDVNGGAWDGQCADFANKACVGAGECCRQIQIISTCDPALVGSIEGCLSVGADEWGAIFDVAQFGGLGGDTYNPIGDAPAAAATFSKVLFFFSGNDKREALSDTTDDQHGLTNDDSCDTVATLSPLILTDTNGDTFMDTSVGAFDVTCDTTVDLSFQLESHVESLNGFGAVGALLTQEYTITNNLPTPVSFTLVEHNDLDLLWDVEANGATGDSVGTMSNAPGCGIFVTQKEAAIPNTAITVSSPQATRYYGSKGYSASDVLNPPNIVIDGAQEPSASAGTGTGTATLNTTGPTFAWSVSYTGLGSVATAAHFHGPMGQVGSTAPVITPPGDLMPPAATMGMFSGGPIAITATQQAEIVDGEWYLNIHSNLIPTGEIRGQVGPTWGFGTDLQQWEQRGIAIPWRNRIPVVGLNTDGFSGDLLADTLCDPCDASMGLEIPVSLPAMGSIVVTIHTTYGSETPMGEPCGSACPTCTGDFAAAFGVVNAADLAILLGNWGMGCNQGAGCCMDINGIGGVNAADLALLLGNWGACN